MKLRSLALTGAAALVAVGGLTGCQSLDGIDVGKSLDSLVRVQSYEGSSRINYKLELGAPVKGRPELAAIQEGTLSLSKVKQEAPSKLSMEGELLYGGGKKVPLQLAMDDEALSVKLAGSEEALRIESPEAQLSVQVQELLAGSTPFALDLSKMDVNQLLTELSASLLHYMPNPRTVSASDAKWTAGGTERKGKKLHAELTGKELGQALQKGLQDMLSDPEQSDQTVNRLMLAVTGGNETTAGIYTMLAKPMLLNMAEDPQVWESLNGMLEDVEMMKWDFYIEPSTNQISRFDYDLKLSGLELMDGAVKGISLQGTASMDTIGGAVKADTLGDSGMSLQEPGALARYMKKLDTGTAAYQLLMKDLQMTRKHLTLPSALGVEPGASDTPYIDPQDQKLLVPVRYVAENLDADVLWLGDTQQVKVTDIMSGKTLLFTLGSKTVLVNGQPVEMEAGKPVLTGGYTFVPIRFIAEELGAEVSWDSDTAVASIIRN